nr:PAAR domain-containing protein [uncultured Psychrobacter sp.]
MAAYITVGAKTTHGGEVITGSPHTTHNGVQVSRKGDKVICRKCKKVTTILTGDPSFIVDGAPIAREGDVTSCGAKLIAIQHSFAESDFEVFGVEQPEPMFEQPAPLQFPKTDPEAVLASFAASKDQKPDLFAEPDRGDKDLDAWRENAVSDGLERGLVADSSGGLLSGVGPSNEKISDYTGIPKDKIDAAANTLGGFNQMWSFGASDAIAGTPDPNSAGTKAGQVAGMAAGVYTGSAAGSGIKAAQATKAAQAQRAAAIEKANKRVADNAKAYNDYVGASDSVVVRTTLKGDKAMRITRENGNVVDISRSRVKEYIPNNHPKAPPGVMQKRKFPNSLPGSKGYKRLPTNQEKKVLEHTIK